MKNKIGGNADKKFCRRDYCRTDKSSKNKRAGFERKIDKIKRTKNRSSGEEHCPMGIRTENDFNEAIHDASDAKNDCVFDYPSLVRTFHFLNLAFVFFGSFIVEKKRLFISG